MTTFWVVAIALMVAVVALLAVPLAKRRSAGADDVDHDRSNVALFQDQMAELARDRAQGLLSGEQFEQARVELSQRLLAEVPPGANAPNTAPAKSGGPWRYAILACVPVVAVLAYLALGMPQALDPDVVKPKQAAPADHERNLDQLAARLAERLQKHPDDTEAWVLLARSYQMLGRAPEAVQAFARAIELVPNSAQLYADYADVQVAANDGQWTPQAQATVRKALEIDPAHPKALWLAGTEAFVRKDYAAAIAHWEKLLPLAEPGTDVAQMIQKNIDEARALAGGAKPSVAAAQTAESTPPAAQAAAKAAGAETLKGTVTLDTKLGAEVKSTDAVFVFARAAQGPKVPLAIRRITVQQLPYAFSLDDAAAMAPGMMISKFDQVIVGARVSRSGDAMAKPGDLEGYSAPVKPGATGIEVRINARVQ